MSDPEPEKKTATDLDPTVLESLIARAGLFTLGVVQLCLLAVPWWRIGERRLTLWNAAVTFDGQRGVGELAVLLQAKVPLIFVVGLSVLMIISALFGFRRAFVVVGVLCVPALLLTWLAAAGVPTMSGQEIGGDFSLLAPGRMAVALWLLSAITALAADRARR